MNRPIQPDIEEGWGIRGVLDYNDLKRFMWGMVNIQCLVCDEVWMLRKTTWDINKPEICPICGSHSLAHEWIEEGVFQFLLKRIADGTYEPFQFPENDDIHKSAVRRYVRVDSI